MNRLERVGRGFTATAFAVLFAALSHVIAGAEAPSFLAIAVTVVVVLPLSIALAGVRLSVTRLSMVVLASQALFHSSFAMIGTSAGGSAVSAANSAHTGHSMHSGHMIAETLALTPTGASALMWLSHTFAAVATILLLVYGERAALTLVTFAFGALRALGASIAVVRLNEWPALATPLFVHPQPLAMRTLSAAPRRGPPAFSA